MTSYLLPLQNFNCEGEAEVIASRWQEWKRSFEIFITAANIQNPENKRATLLHTGGVALQDILFNIPGALEIENENDNSYDITIKKLDEYFSEKHNIIYE